MVASQTSVPPFPGGRSPSPPPVSPTCAGASRLTGGSGGHDPLSFGLPGATFMSPSLPKGGRSLPGQPCGGDGHPGPPGTASSSASWGAAPPRVSMRLLRVWGPAAGRRVARPPRAPTRTTRRRSWFHGRGSHSALGRPAGGVWVPPAPLPAPPPAPLPRPCPAVRALRPEPRAGLRSSPLPAPALRLWRGRLT